MNFKEKLKPIWLKPLGDCIYKEIVTSEAETIQISFETFYKE